jgi:hypothetical protein
VYLDIFLLSTQTSLSTASSYLPLSVPFGMQRLEEEEEEEQVLSHRHHHT